MYYDIESLPGKRRKAGRGLGTRLALNQLISRMHRQCVRSRDGAKRLLYSHSGYMPDTGRKRSRPAASTSYVTSILYLAWSPSANIITSLWLLTTNWLVFSKTIFSERRDSKEDWRNSWKSAGPVMICFRRHCFAKGYVGGMARG